MVSISSLLQEETANPLLSSCSRMFLLYNPELILTPPQSIQNAHRASRHRRAEKRSLRHGHFEIRRPVRFPCVREEG